jgi:hypothetical protein
MKLIHIDKIAETKNGYVRYHEIQGMKYQVCLLTCKGTMMKQFEYLIHTPDFIREVRKTARGTYVEYDELQELGRQGWELAAAQPGGKWIFKREADSALQAGQGRPVKPAFPDGARGR